MIDSADIKQMETVIRDLAGTVLASIDTRRSHPSYGVTLTKIRAQREQMEGAIGLYMVMTDQATHAGVPALAKFDDWETSARVTSARTQANAM